MNNSHWLTTSNFWAGIEPDSKFKLTKEGMNFSHSLTQPGPKLMSEDSHIDLVADLTSSTDILFGICSTNNTHRYKYITNDLEFNND